MKRLTINGAALGITLLLGSSSVLAANTSQHWAQAALEKWNAYGILKGDEKGDLKPNDPITRAQLATLLDRVFCYTEVGSPSLYMDLIASPDRWYVTSANKVTAQELMYIEGFLFEPNAPVTREEAAYAISKAYELAPLTETKTVFKDENQIASWAKEAISTLATYGYISGTPEGNFLPKSTLTRAQVVTMLNNITPTFLNSSQTVTKSMKGNVVVGSSEITLKNLTIDGNLYLTSKVEKAVLEQVTVTGTVYIRGGNLQMSGTYQEVHLSTGAPMELTAGSIEKLVVSQTGSTLKVAPAATVVELVQKAPIQIEGQGTIGQTGQIGQGTIGQTGQIGQGGGGSQVGQNQAITLQAVEMTISGKTTELPVTDQSIVIDIPSLSTRFNPSDTIDSFKILATPAGSMLTSSIGRIEVGGTCTFLELENQLGLIRELATEVGLPPGLIIEQLLGENSVTLGSLLDNYAIGKRLAASLGYTLEDSYTFERLLTTSEGTSETVYITLRLQ